MVNFSQVLDKKIDAIERPPNMPIGTYLWGVSKIPEQSVIADGRYEVVDFTLRCLAAQDDVDEDDIKAYGDIKVVTQRHRFMFSTEEKAMFERSLYNLKRFIEDHLKVDGAGDMSIAEALHASVNHQCLGTIRWEPDKKDPEIIYDRIGRTAPID